MIETPSNAHYCLGDDIGHVALIDHSGDDTSVVNSARVSFGKRVEKIGDGDKKLIKYLLTHNHGTPLEHTSLTYLVKCPLFVARQWHRHRVGVSINEISARYVEVCDEFYTPNEFRTQSSYNRQASVSSEFDQDTTAAQLALYKQTIQYAYKAYKDLLNAGVAREQARGVLPLCTYTQFYWTCNLRSLLHFVALRDHPGAQYEISLYAKAMLKQAQEHFPHTIASWQEIDRP